jgi:hypothetical protein
MGNDEALYAEHVSAEGNSAFEDFISALGGLHSRRVRELLRWVQKQLDETAETGKAEWEESWQRHLKEMQEVRAREDQKRSDRIARNKEQLQALHQRVRELDEELASRVQSAIPDGASSSAPQVSIERSGLRWTQPGGSMFAPFNCSTAVQKRGCNCVSNTAQDESVQPCKDAGMKGAAQTMVSYFASPSPG